MEIIKDWVSLFANNSVELYLVEKEIGEDKKLKETGREKIFDFVLERAKSTVSKKERLLVKILYYGNSQSEDWGMITVHPDKLRDEFLIIKEYGVVLPRKLYGDICKLIELNYICIPYTVSDLSDEPSEDDLKGIVGVCCEYIAEKLSQQAERPYNIPVRDFEKLIKDSDYKRLDLTLIRDGLRDFGYTKCNTSRNDLTVNGVGKVISLIPENDFIQETITRITKITPSETIKTE